MAYEPTNWKTGDVVTSAKLNKLEQGVASSGGSGELKINVTYNSVSELNTDRYNLVFDKTTQEIIDAFNEGKNVYFFIDGSKMQYRTAKTGGTTLTVDGVSKNTLCCYRWYTDHLTGAKVCGLVFNGDSFDVTDGDDSLIVRAMSDGLNGYPSVQVVLAEF